MNRRFFAAPPPVRANFARSTPQMLQPAATKNISKKPNSISAETANDLKKKSQNTSATAQSSSDVAIARNASTREKLDAPAPPLPIEKDELNDAEDFKPCTQSKTQHNLVQVSQICITKLTQTSIKLIESPIKFKISVLNRLLVVFPVCLTFIANKDSMEFIGSINYKALLQLKFENFSGENFEYEKIESIECGQCKVSQQENCLTCAQNYCKLKEEMLKKCTCPNCTCATLSFLNRCAKKPQPCKRTFVRKRRKFGNLSTHLVLHWENNSAPEYLISTQNRIDSTYMLNRIDQNTSTAIFKMANILLDIKFFPECNNQAQYSQWTKWTEFEIVDEKNSDCQCESNTKLPQTTAQLQSIDDKNFSCFEALDCLESLFCLTANLNVLEHPKDYNIQWQLQIGPVL